MAQPGRSAHPRSEPASSGCDEGVGPATLDLLTEPACWSRLRAHGEGLLHFASGHGSIGLAVPYVLDGDQVVISVVHFSEASRYVPGADVVLEITGRLGRHDRWVVRCAATGRLDGRGPTTSWDRLRLTPTRIRGYAATDVVG